MSIFDLIQPRASNGVNMPAAPLDTTPNVSGGPFVQGLAALGNSLSSLVLPTTVSNPRNTNNPTSNPVLSVLPGMPLSTQLNTALFAAGVAAGAVVNALRQSPEEIRAKELAEKEKKEKEALQAKKNQEVAEALALALRERQRAEQAEITRNNYQTRMNRAETEMDQFLRYAGLAVPPRVRSTIG